MYDSFEKLRSDCLGCSKCRLAQTRTNLVFGVGNENAEVMLIGEGPGEQEDLKGEPFVGKSGQLLDKYLAAVDLDRHKNVDKFIVTLFHIKQSCNDFSSPKKKAKITSEK